MRHFYKIHCVENILRHAGYFTFFVSKLLIFSSLSGLDFIRVCIYCFINCFCYFLLPALGDHQREVLVEILVAIKKLIILRDQDSYDLTYLARQQLQKYPNWTWGDKWTTAYNPSEMARSLSQMSAADNQHVNWGHLHLHLQAHWRGQSAHSLIPALLHFCQ